jgi:hypothetical protein
MMAKSTDMVFVQITNLTYRGRYRTDFEGRGRGRQVHRERVREDLERQEEFEGVIMKIHKYLWRKGVVYKREEKGCCDRRERGITHKQRKVESDERGNE